MFHGHSKSAIRFALALLGAEILAFKGFKVFSSKLGAVLREGQAGSSLVFSLAYLALSLPWLKELLPQPQLQQCQGSPAGARPTCQEPPLVAPVLII